MTGLYGFLLIAVSVVVIVTALGVGVAWVRSSLRDAGDTERKGARPSGFH